MRQLLLLALYILAGVGLAWLTLWGTGYLGLPHILQVILAAVVFILVLLFGLKRTGTADV